MFVFFLVIIVILIDNYRMTGRVIIVTGANTGIGFSAAQNLCEGGNDVILACRNEDKGKAAVEQILKKNPNALATFMQVS